MGLVTGARPNSVLDVAVRVLTSVAYSAPVFWTGSVLIIVFAVKLGLFPAGGLTSARADLHGFRYIRDVAVHLILPAITLALPFLSVVARITHVAVVDVLGEPFVIAATARGLSRTRIVMHHAAPHALLPVVALVGEHAASVVAGAALTEALFGWPGLGYLVLQAALHRDYPLVTAMFIVIASGVVLCSAATDLLCVYLDPRITLS